MSAGARERYPARVATDSGVFVCQEVIALSQKPLRPCRHPGCSILVPDGYCPAHKPRPQAQRSADSAAWHRLYLRPEWADDLRPHQLLREPYCQECAKHGLRTRATDVDHIRPHKGDWDLFTDRNNLQSLCHSCHSRKTMAERHRK